MTFHSRLQAVFFCLTTTAVGCADSNSPTDPSEVFARRCGGCHGDDGEGSPAGPQIRSLNHGYAEFVVRNGRGREMGFADVMPAFSRDEIEDLEPILAWLDRPPTPQTGLALYARYCGNCHGPDGISGRVGEDSVKEAQEGLDEVMEVVREGEGGFDYAARTEYMPAWTSAQLSDANVALIVAFLATLEPQPDDDDDDD